MKKINYKDKKQYNYEEPDPNRKNLNWVDKDLFLKKLKEVEDYIGENIKCDGYFCLNKIMWDKTFREYIDKNNIKPSDVFIDYIFRFVISTKQKKIKFKGEFYLKNKEKGFVKLDKNQIMILDSLMNHGGYTKKYHDSKKNIFRYSEHSGLLDFGVGGNLEKIIISGNTTRVDSNDEEIYLPYNIPEALDYEYLFHTHPPTPKAGGRVDKGILYEIPSKSDLFHFIHHYNNGETQGSIIISPEGMYIISVLDMEKKIIFSENSHGNNDAYDEKKFNSDVNKIFRKIQTDNIAKYGTKFKTSFFYSIIAQDISFIKEINEVLNKYKLHIYYYPRVKQQDNWIIDTVYLPIYIIEPLSTQNL